jgi:hypothetical protein
MRDPSWVRRVCESFIIITAVSRISRSVWGVIGTPSGQGQFQRLVRVGLRFPFLAWIVRWLGVCVVNPWFQSCTLRTEGVVRITWKGPSDQGSRLPVIGVLTQTQSPGLHGCKGPRVTGASSWCCRCWAVSLEACTKPFRNLWRPICPYSRRSPACPGISGGGRPYRTSKGGERLHFLGVHLILNSAKGNTSGQGSPVS